MDEKIVDAKTEENPPASKQNGDAAASSTEDAVKTESMDAEIGTDPLLLGPSPVAREGDYIILVFGDGRQYFAQCLKSWRGKSPKSAEKW